MKNKATLSRLKTLIWVSVVFILASGTFAHAQPNYEDFLEGHNEAHKNCSNRTLFGAYEIQIEGTALDLNIVLRTLVLAHFNGAGQFSE